MTVLRLSRRPAGWLVPGALLALPILAVSAWWQASPGYAVARLQHAAVSGDAAEVAARVDFPALRQSLKAQLRDRLLAEARPESSALSAIGTRMALAFVEPMVDAAVTPDVVQAVVAHAADADAPAALTAVAVLAMPDANISRDGLDRFALRPAAAPDMPALIFCRDGLSWQLCGVDLSLAA